MIERVRERKEHHKQRGKLYRIGVAAAGVALMVIGLLLSVPGVPGPGLLIAAVGLGLLALEFDRAERLLERILDRVETAAEKAGDAKPWQKAVGVAATVLAIVAMIAVVVFWDIPLVPG
jgi:uncharacterized protein (TIGR02611 family)